jgi:hypothetical protein
MYNNQITTRWEIVVLRGIVPLEMAASGKNRRADRGRRHLIDVSDSADPPEPEDAWLADSSSTLTEQRPLATSGKVEIWIEPKEYEEYSRLKNGLAPDGPESTGVPDTPPTESDENPADGRGQDASMAHINTTPAPAVATPDGAQGEDEFLAQFTQTPRRSQTSPTARPGSAALEGVTAAPGRSDRPPRDRGRVRGGGWHRWASLAGVVAVLAGVASVLLQSHTPTRTPNPSSVTSPARPDPFANFSATLSAIDHQVRSAADNAVSQERAAAAERRVAARELTDRRHAAAERATRTRTRHRAPAAAQTTARSAPPVTTTATAASAPKTVTVTQAPPTATTPEPSTSQTTSTATTPTHAYGEGGVLGAGHSSASS